MIPTPGRIVLAVGNLARANGTDTAPAIITRVWPNASPDESPWCTNVTIFRDADEPQPATSVYVHANEEAARGALASGASTALYWPPRA